jgi:AbrB family looped-hinge helix DNA binding protein
MPQCTSRVGKRGVVVIPAALRRPFGIEEGSLVIAEDRGEAHTHPSRRSGALRKLHPKRRAEFLLSNAVDGEDYARAEEEVRKMRLDPSAILHRRRRP